MDNTKKEIFIGVVVMLLLCAVVLWGVRGLLSQMLGVEHDDTTVALSAWFDKTEGNPPFHVAGVVLHGGQPAKDGQAKVTIERFRKPFQQSLLLQIKDGKFDTGDQPALREISHDDRLRVAANVLLPQVKRSPAATAEIYVNNPAPILNRQTWTIMFLVVATVALVFFWSFTGRSTGTKNTVAVIFSYFVMLVFLAIPLVLPYVLADMFPEITEAMKETPVGFVVARPSGLEPQWVLNIGGSAEAPKHANAELDTPALSEPSALPPVTSAAGSAINSPGVQKPAGITPNTSSDTNPNKSAASATSVPTPKPNVDDGIPGETRIHGGLVIPLFVVILSVTGGAINMTRKLPIAQHEAAALGSPLQGLAQVGRAVRNRMTGVKDTALMDINAVAPPPAPAPAQVNAVAIHTQTSGTDTTVAVEQSTETGGSTEGSLTEQTAQWRQSLITQHMYLLSAPFLAIAVYYVLDWLQLSSKVPILVIVSFSVGLISDKILGTILGLAETFVDKGESPAGGDSTRTTVKVAAAASGK